MSAVGRLALGVTLAVAGVLSLSAPDRSASFDASVDVTTLPTLPCGTPAGDAFDGWCGDWKTNPPRLDDAPHRSFAPFGPVRLVRVEGSAVRALQGRLFGDVRLALPCEVEDLYYAGTFGLDFGPRGQILACTRENDAILAGAYRSDSDPLRSGIFDIALAAPRAFAGEVTQALSDTQPNHWSGECEDGWCATAVRPDPAAQRCRGKRATVVGEPSPIGGTTPVLGTQEDDVIVGTDGDDVIFGRGGKDSVCAGEGEDVILGGAGGDLLRGAQGDDRILGGSGRDRIEPGPGADRVDGGPGDDILSFDSERARVEVDLEVGLAIGRSSGTDRLLAIEGVVGSRANDRLRGDAGQDVLFGNRGADDIQGLGGPDLLFGEEGRDELNGGPGGDDLDGGAGVDVCRNGEVHLRCERLLE